MPDFQPLPAEFAGLDQLATMVVVVGAGGECLLANAQFESVMRLSRRSVHKALLPDWFEDRQRLVDTLAGVAANQYSSSRFDALLKRAWTQDDGLPVHVIVSQLEPGEDGAARVMVELIEISQQARQDREERSLDQVQATKELTRNLAHEIKNPLGGIRGSAQLLERELNNPALREYTQVIISESDRLQDLMQRLLSSHRTMQPGQVNIHEILERVLRLIHAEFSGVRVRRDYDTSLPELTGDREQLIQAILNITRNAAQAMNGKGEIIFRTRALRQVTLVKKRYPLALELQVIDNGPGIPEDIRDKIFYPLVSGREGGSGLGLTLTQSFIHQHHGSIDVESRPGRTCFHIKLPLSNEQGKTQ